MPTALQAKNDSGFGRLTGIEKNRILRERDVDARLIDFGERGDRALQLAFERAAIVDLFGEIAGAEVGAVEKLEADAPGFRQARTGERQSAHPPRDRREPETVAPVSSSRYSIPASRIFCVTAAASSGGECAVEDAERAFVLPPEKPEGGGADHDRDEDSEICWPRLKRLPDCCQLIHGDIRNSSDAQLHRHLHDFLVGRNELISHLLEQFEREFRPLGGERDAGDVALSAGQKVHGGRFGVLLRAFHLVDRTAESGGEA